MPSTPEAPGPVIGVCLLECLLLSLVSFCTITSPSEILASTSELPVITHKLPEDGNEATLP